jgi:hypothetical protein
MDLRADASERMRVQRLPAILQLGLVRTGTYPGSKLYHDCISGGPKTLRVLHSSMEVLLAYLVMARTSREETTLAFHSRCHAT